MGKQAKASLVKAPAVEVLPAEDQQLTKDTVTAITAFVRGVVVFFRVAAELEQKAKNLVMAANTLKPPTDAASDQIVVNLLQRSNDGKKVAEEHWHPITSVVWNFHRWLTGRRKPTLDAHDEVVRIAQPLHNGWVAKEKRRVEQEAENARRENERAAQAERDRELQRLEDEALKLEASSEALSEREQRYVELVAYGLNSPVTSARSAGYRNPEQTAAKLGASAKIIAAIKGKQDAAALRRQGEARAAQPLEVESVRTAKLNVATGARDTATWSGEITDEAATIEAFRSGKHGIPGDLFQINPVKLNEYAKSLHERLDLWPGVKHKRTTRTY